MNAFPINLYRRIWIVSHNKMLHRLTKSILKEIVKKLKYLIVAFFPLHVAASSFKQMLQVFQQ